VTGTTAVPDRRPVILEELLQPYTDRGTGRSLIEKWLITREEFIEKVSLAVLNDPNSPPSLPELTLRDPATASRSFAAYAANTDERVEAVR
jgi:hypothetical protein